MAEQVERFTDAEIDDFWSKYFKPTFDEICKEQSAPNPTQEKVNG